MNHRIIDEKYLEKPKLMNKVFNIIKSILNGVIISGMIILVIGLYYLIIKAGIPYQDPTEELRIQYVINMGIGEMLIGNGFLVFILGLIGTVGIYRARIRHLVLLAMVLPGALISKGRNLVDQGGVVNGNVRNIGYSRTI